MPNLFNIDIAGIVNSAIAPGLLSATLHVMSYDEVDPDNPTAGRERTSTDYDCKAVFTSHEEVAQTPTLGRAENSLVDEGDRVVLIIAKSLPTGVIPVRENEVTLEGVRCTISRVRRDPAAATYICWARSN